MRRRFLPLLVPTSLFFAADSTPAQTTTRVSVDSWGTEGNNSSDVSAVTADGRIVAFVSLASNLVAGDTNGRNDVFVHDRSTGHTERVSVDSSGAEANSYSYFPALSADGQIVAFSSTASNLVAGDTNGDADVFIHDRSTGLTERVSVDSSGAEGVSTSHFPAISADGQVVAFQSYSSNLVAGDTNGIDDVFVHDRSTGITERVSVDSSGVQGNHGSLGPSISANGQIVAFFSYASNLVAGDTNVAYDVFVHDRSSGLTERVSVDSSGAEANDPSSQPLISADGRIVAFNSGASNLVSGDTNGDIDVFVHDRSTALTERVSVDSSGAQGNDYSHYPSISADGRIVAFYSDASNLVSGDTNGTWDVFVHDRSTGLTERVSVDSSGAEGDNGSYLPALSADAQVVAFSSYASNLVVGDLNAEPDIFVHERCSIDASWSNYGAGFPGTNGVPSFTAQSNPLLGTTVTLDLANSNPGSTFGLLLIGFQQAQIHSALGGDLLLIPALTTVVALPSGGTSFSGAIPSDATLCGFVIDLQAWEADPGAAKSVSFTPGLQLVLGH